MQPEVGEERRLIDVDGNLFRAPLSGDVLRLGELRAPAIAAKADEVLGDDRDRASRALLPRCVGRRVDDDLTDRAPTSVMRVAPRHQKPREGIGHGLSSGLGGVDVEMPQRGADLPAFLHRLGQFLRGPRSVSFRVDLFTVLFRRSPGDNRRPPRAARPVSSQLWILPRSVTW